MAMHSKRAIVFLYFHCQGFTASLHSPVMTILLFNICLQANVTRKNQELFESNIYN